MNSQRPIEASDILDMQVYASERKAQRNQMINKKKNRRLAIGPFVTMIFENFDTMLYQVHEMLFTERGGEEQIQEELAAYNPLIPRGNELSVTMMIHIDNPIQRARELAQLGGIEEHCYLSVGGERISADWENDVDRTTPEGKTSAVHFLHFRMNEQQAQKFRDNEDVSMGIDHKKYSHIAKLPEAVRIELSNDL